MLNYQGSRYKLPNRLKGQLHKFNRSLGYFMGPNRQRQQWRGKSTNDGLIISLSLSLSQPKKNGRENLKTPQIP